MKIYSDISLDNFEAWSGGYDTLEVVRDKGLFERLEAILEEDIFPEGCSDTELNDFLWFERDAIADWLGFRDWEDLDRDEDEDDTEEDEEDKIDVELLNEYIGNKTDFDTYCDNANCDTCPFDDHCDHLFTCKEIYNAMLAGHSFEDAVEKFGSY